MEPTKSKAAAGDRGGSRPPIDGVNGHSPLVLPTVNGRSTSSLPAIPGLSAPVLPLPGFKKKKAQNGSESCVTVTAAAFLLTRSYFADDPFPRLVHSAHASARSIYVFRQNLARTAGGTDTSLSGAGRHGNQKAAQDQDPSGNQAGEAPTKTKLVGHPSLPPKPGTVSLRIGSEPRDGSAHPEGPPGHESSRYSIEMSQEGQASVSAHTKAERATPPLPTVEVSSPPFAEGDAARKSGDSLVQTNGDSGAHTRSEEPQQQRPVVPLQARKTMPPPGKIPTSPRIASRSGTPQARKNLPASVMPARSASSQQLSASSDRAESTTPKPASSSGLPRDTGEAVSAPGKAVSLATSHATGNGSGQPISHGSRSTETKEERKRRKEEKRKRKLAAAGILSSPGSTGPNPRSKNTDLAVPPNKMRKLEQSPSNDNMGGGLRVKLGGVMLSRVGSPV